MFNISRTVPAAAVAALLITAGCGGNAESDEPDQAAPERAAADTDAKSPEESKKDQKDKKDNQSDQAGKDGKDKKSGADDAGDDDDSKPAEDEPDDSGPSRLTVAGGPFEELTFSDVQCDGDKSDFLLQGHSDDPAVVVTVLFTEGTAVQASAQTDPDEGESTIWSDQDAKSVGESVSRDGDTVELSDTELVPFDGDGAITVSGTLTCTEPLSG